MFIILGSDENEKILEDFYMSKENILREVNEENIINLRLGSTFQNLFPNHPSRLKVINYQLLVSIKQSLKI